MTLFHDILSNTNSFMITQDKKWITYLGNFHIISYFNFSIISKIEFSFY
jgi:hypothetical protein